MNAVLDRYEVRSDPSWSSFPGSGVALGTCQRCHASAASEMTFSSLNNIRGRSRSGSGSTTRGVKRASSRNSGSLCRTFRLRALPGPAPHRNGPRPPARRLHCRPSASTNARVRAPTTSRLATGRRPGGCAAPRRHGGAGGGGYPRGPIPSSSPPSPLSRRQAIPGDSPASGPTTSLPGRKGPRRTSPPTTAWAATAASAAVPPV